MKPADQHESKHDVLQIKCPDAGESSDWHGGLSVGLSAGTGFQLERHLELWLNQVKTIS